MKATTYTASIWEETFELRADWSNAASQIERMTDDGWKATGRQVADFQHSPAAAMRWEIESMVVAGGDAVEDCQDDIDDAIEAAMGEEFEPSKISIFRDGVWSGDGTIDRDGEIECSAVLGDDQDASDETYQMIMDALDEEPQDSGRYTGEGSIERPDGNYSWVVS